MTAIADLLPKGHEAALQEAAKKKPRLKAARPRRVLVKRKPTEPELLAGTSELAPFASVWRFRRGKHSRSTFVAERNEGDSTVYGSSPKELAHYLRGWRPKAK